MIRRIRDGVLLIMVFLVLLENSGIMVNQHLCLTMQTSQFALGSQSMSCEHSCFCSLNVCHHQNTNALTSRLILHSKCCYNHTISIKLNDFINENKHFNPLSPFSNTLFLSFQCPDDHYIYERNYVTKIKSSFPLELFKKNTAQSLFCVFRI